MKEELSFETLELSEKYELIQQVKDAVYLVLNDVLGSEDYDLKISKKEDDSLVTKIDQNISDQIKVISLRKDKLKNFQFFSEEDHNPKFSYPLIILDPIDGTRELVKGIPECAVSLSYFFDSHVENLSNFSWILNPFTGQQSMSFCEEPQTLFHRSLLKKSFFNPTLNPRKPLIGAISRNEWEKMDSHKKNHIMSLKNDCILIPVGSIANKLSLLANGAYDFVISFSPKSLWDICAGSHILNLKGIRFYEQGEKRMTLNQMRFYPPLLWCREENRPQIEKWFFF